MCIHEYGTNERNQCRKYGLHDKLCALVRLIRIEKVLYSLDALAEPRGEKVFFRTLYAEPKEESTIFSWFLMPVTISSSMIDPDVLASRPKVEDADTKFRKFLQFSLVANGVQTDLEEKLLNLETCYNSNHLTNGLRLYFPINHVLTKGIKAPTKRRANGQLCIRIVWTSFICLRQSESSRKTCYSDACIIPAR